VSLYIFPLFLSNYFLCGIQGIIADNNVMIWACVLDWIPINMTNQDEAQSILESFLPPSFHGFVYTTFGSLSQIIQSGFPYMDISEAVICICPPMHVDILKIFCFIQNNGKHPDLDA